MGLALAALAGAFVLGALAPYTLGAPDTVWLTGSIRYHPAQRPLLHGLLWAVNLAGLELAIAVGLTVTALLWRWGLLIPVAAVGMLLAGAAGFLLALFGGFLGLSGDQRGGMGIVAVTLGGMGGLMTFAVIRDVIRSRGGRSRRRPGASDPPATP